MFAFKFDKAIQAAAYLLRREHPRQQMNYMRLLKMLYIADRESIRQTGCPITGDRVVAMKQGPVLSGVYNLIKEEHDRSSEWSGFIRRKGKFNVWLFSDPGQPNLSRLDAETLERVAMEHHSDTWRSLVKLTHTFQEWKTNNPGGGSSREIPLKDIVEAVGRSADLADIEEDARTDCAFASLFGARYDCE